MPLAGTFDVLDFGEVLVLLSRRAATGRLQVRTSGMHGTIWLAEGRATSAEIGSAAGGETRNNWRSLIEEICFDALRSARGSFEFHPEDEASVPAGPRVRLETVVAAGKKRLEMWRDVESVIHSFEAVPRMADSLSHDSVTLSQDKWRILVAVDGRRNVAALAKRLDIELLEFCQLLKPLIEGGAVVLDQPEGWLKSLPKVRLDVAGRDGDWPGGAPPVAGPIDSAILSDALEASSLVSVATAVETNGHSRNGADTGTPAIEAAATDGSAADGPADAGAGPAGDPAASDKAGRRLLRSRRAARAGIDD